MTYTVTDITELIRHHLVLSVDNDETADGNLRQLVSRIADMATTPLWHTEESYWMACEGCGAWVSSELLGPDGAGEDAYGAFCCTQCRFGEDAGDD